MRSLLHLFLVAMLLALVPSSASPTTARAGDELPSSIELVFGVYKSDKATEMYRQFSPVIETLTSDLAESLKRDVDIQLRIFRTYQEGLDALVDGQVDFVRFGPASYILALERNKDLRLIAMEEKNGETRFHGLIIARKDSGLTSLAQLAGKSFAFGDENSTIGRFLAQERLLDAGIDASRLSRHAYLGRHDMVVRAVQMGDFDAGAVKENTFKKLNKDGSMIVIETFDNVTKPWIASSRLPDAVRDALATALLQYDDAEVLDGLGVSRFIPGDDGEYDFVRKGMKRALAFDKRD